MAKNNLNILILSAKPESFSTSSLAQEAKDRGHQVSIIDPKTMIIQISSSPSGYDKVYLINEKGEAERVYAKKIDVVIPRIGSGNDYGFAIVEQFENMGVFVTSSANGLRIASDKFISTQRLSNYRGIRNPRTVFANTTLNLKENIDLVGGLPCIAKRLKGAKGEGVFLLTDSQSADAMFRALADENILLQEFIDSGTQKKDIRVVIIDNKVVAAYSRYAAKKDFRSNYSLSKKGEQIELSEEEAQMSLDAAAACDLSACAGVDLMRNSDQTITYCIEVNGSPGLEGVSKITGVNVAQEIIDFAERGALKHKKNKSEHSEK